jgi:hypothetical protein
MDLILILRGPYYAANVNILFPFYFGPVISVPKDLFLEAHMQQSDAKKQCSRADAITILPLTPHHSLLQPVPCFFPIIFLLSAAAAYHLLRPSAPHARLAICTR